MPATQNISISQARSSVFPELDKLSLEELQFLNENEDGQMEMILEFSNIKNQNDVIGEIMGHIEELAEQNLGKKEQLQSLKESIDLRVDQVTKLTLENEELYSVYQTISDTYSPRNIQEELGKAAKKAEEESEEIAESFLRGDLDVDKFLNVFIKAKSLGQVRRTKQEKLLTQLNRLEKAGF